VLRRHHGREFQPDEFRYFSEFMILVFASFVVPICALAFGTASVGGDREDRTLVFVLMRPIPRPIVLLAKFIATLPLGVGIGGRRLLALLPVGRGSGPGAFPLYLPATREHDVAYVCLFHLFAVTFRHSTIIALIYALSWNCCWAICPAS